MRFRNPHSAFRILVCVSLCTAGCASWPRSWGRTPCCISSKPSISREPIWWHLFDVTVVSQVKQLFQVVRLTRRALGSPLGSLNLRAGSVDDTTFFTDRDPALLSSDQVRWGPTPPGDLGQPPFLVTKPKLEGKTPGFFVRDARGVRYLFKLDPAESPELLSGAEVVTSKLLHALGYHVPSYEILFVQPEALHLDPKDAPLRELIEPRLREGTVRVAASRILEGEILGPAPFKRFRDCAEVRALKVAYAWLNNIDTKDHNSLLVWDGTKTVGYLIDFGTSLGADAGVSGRGAGPKTPCAGWLNIVDLTEASLKLLTFGLHRPPCALDVSEPVSPSIGRFSIAVDPDRWKPYAPNLAFDEMSEEDARWIAGRMERLSRTQIEAAVSAGQYREAQDAAYLAEVLDRRRLAIVGHYLGDSTTEVAVR